MKFCLSCGSASVQYTIPKGDNRQRHICNDCDFIFYENPRIICGTLPIHQGKILLCKREIEPRAGFWTLPAGCMENNETIEEACLRETLEEANVVGLNAKLYSIINLPHINQVHVFYKCDIRDGEFSPGSETTETQLYAPENIPWDSLAFLTISRCIENYLQDLQTGDFKMRIENIRSNPHQLKP